MPSSAKRGRSCGVEALGVLDAVAQALRLPGLAAALEGVEGVAVRPVADRVNGDGPLGLGGAADDLLELLRGRDRHARAVEQGSRLRAERPVHEHLQVADAEEVVPGAASHPDPEEVVEPLVRDGLPHAHVQAVELAEPAEDPQRADAAVLVVDRADPSRVREADTLARRRDPLVVADRDEPRRGTPTRPPRAARPSACRPGRVRRRRPRPRRRRPRARAPRS